MSKRRKTNEIQDIRVISNIALEYNIFGNNGFNCVPLAEFHHAIHQVISSLLPFCIILTINQKQIISIQSMFGVM